MTKNDARKVYYPDRAFRCEIPEDLRGKKVRATWITFRERSIWCLDFSGYENDPEGLRTEIEVSDVVIKQQAENSLLVAIVLHQTKMTPEIVGFFRTNAERRPNPIHKMAGPFMPSHRGRWHRVASHGGGARKTRLLHDYEQAKEWLVKERD